MGDKHSKKTRGSGPGNGREAFERGSPELREQIAALAEQVRRLSLREGAAVTAPPAAPAPPPAAPAPPPAAPAPPPAAPAPPPAAPARAQPPARAVAAEPEPAPPASRGELLAPEVIAMTERAAEQIRESARREADRIRAQRRASRPAPVLELIEIVRRQRTALGALTAEIELLRQGAEVLRGQVQLLENELAQIDEILGTASDPPGSVAFSAPAALRGTSPRRHG